MKCQEAEHFIMRARNARSNNAYIVASRDISIQWRVFVKIREVIYSKVSATASSERRRDSFAFAFANDDDDDDERKRANFHNYTAVKTARESETLNLVPREDGLYARNRVNKSPLENRN